MNAELPTAPDHASQTSVRVFLDMKVTSLESPQLLSIGLVADDGLECYIELDLESPTGQQRVAVSSPKVLRNVLSQWNRDLMSRVVTENLGFDAADWLHRLAEHRDSDLVLVHSDGIRAQLLETELKLAGRRWSWVAPRLRWSTVSCPSGNASADLAMVQSWASSSEAEGIARHHALADARALAAGLMANRSQRR